jgi:hypothetical protein
MFTEGYEPVRFAEELRDAEALLQNARVQLNDLSDRLYKIANEENCRVTSGRALIAPSLSLREFADIIDKIKTAIPHRRLPTTQPDL